jgi:hypothetical protein
MHFFRTLSQSSSTGRYEEANRLNESAGTGGGMGVLKVPLVADDGVSENPFEPLLPKTGEIGYHGTSAAYCESIESHGLWHTWQPFTLQDCVEVTKAFEKLQWFGSRQPPIADVGVLRRWGPQRDARLSGYRHMYLAESCAEATVYASFPGGETVSPLIYCIEGLLEFSGNASLRASHVESLNANSVSTP